MVLFVHRDAEGETLDQRLREFDGVQRSDYVPVIPVRMSEAWILFDAEAIAKAAGRPSATVVVPKVSDLESLIDPKAALEKLLFKAAGSPTGRKKKTFDRSLVSRRVNVASLIEDFAPLEALEAFQRFQEALGAAYPYGRSE